MGGNPTKKIIFSFGTIFTNVLAKIGSPARFCLQSLFSWFKQKTRKSLHLAAVNQERLSVWLEMEDLNVEMESEEPSPQAAGPILTISDTCGSSLKLGIAKLDGNLKSSMEHGQICLRRSPILVNPAVKVGHPTFPQIIPRWAFTLLCRSMSSCRILVPNYPT